MIKIYGFPKSRSTRALWAAEEAGVDYEFIKIDLPGGVHRGSEFGKLNPMKKVPVLEHGDLVLSESVAICTYLGQQGTAVSLVPDATPAIRAEYDRWCCFVISELEQPLWTMAKHSYVLPSQLRIPQIKRTAEFEFELALDALAKQLADNEYAVAGEFTIVDVLVSHTLLWGITARQKLGHRNLKAYVRRMSNREALVRARAREEG